MERPNNVVESLLKKIAASHDNLDTLRGEYMARCKGPRGKIKDAMATAKEHDLNMSAFRELVKEHLDARKKKKRIAELEQDDVSALDEMIAALGPFADTALGEAAVRRAQADGETLDRLQ